jgi:hypothetical protein
MTILVVVTCAPARSADEAVRERQEHVVLVIKSTAQMNDGRAMAVGCRRKSASEACIADLPKLLGAATDRTLMTSLLPMLSGWDHD